MTGSKDNAAPENLPGERLHALDAVRGFALLLGVAFHATGSFLPGPAHAPIWPVEDTQRSWVLAAVFFTTHAFRMTTFFLIAGFFAHMTFHRKGAASFIGDRLKRIGIPLVVGWPFMIVGIIAASLWGLVIANGGVMPHGPSPAFPKFPAFPLTHLWFLYVLLELYAATLILRGLVALIDRGGRLRAGLDRLVGALMRGPFAALVLAIPVAVVFAANPHWLMWFGIKTPDDSFVTNAQAIAGFGTAFGFGWLLNRQIDLLEILRRRWVVNLGLAIAMLGVSWAIATPTLFSTPPEALHLVGAATYALAAWTTTFAAIGMAMQSLSGFSPARRYIADASYWVYLAHLPIVLALQAAVSQQDWPWPAKFAVVLGGALILCFGSYQLLVRHSFIGGVLNGPRPRKAKKAARLQTQTA